MNQERFSNSEFEREIEAHGVVIEQPRTFPKISIEYSAFGQESEPIREHIAILEDWLDRPYVSDEYGGSERHDERRAWRDEMSAKYKGTPDESRMRQLFHGNKQSNNGLTIAYTRMELIELNLGKNKKFARLLEQIKAITQKAPNPELFTSAKSPEAFESMPTPEERRKKIGQLEDVIYEMIHVIGKFSNERPN